MSDRPDIETLDGLPPRSQVAGGGSSVFRSLPTAPPPAIDGYQVRSFLGRGGMGTVWRAWQLSTRRDVALKLMDVSILGSERAKRRFDREVELTSRLQHPNIARVYDSGVLQGVYFYAMEYVDGVPLDEYVRGAALSHDSLLQLMLHICDAVQHAHQRGVIHRDLKPSNILVDKEGHAHVLDFGLARLMDQSDPASAAPADEGQTIEVYWAGTPAYMSPEQASGRGALLDTRSDVYTLGVILFQLLLGRSPIDLTGGHMDVLRRVSAGELLMPRPHEKMGTELKALVLKAMAREPDERYQSAGALATDIRNYLTGLPITARPPTLRYLLVKKAVRHRGLVSLGAFAAAAMAVLATTAWLRIGASRDSALASAASERVQRKVADESRRVAEEERAQAELRRADALVAAASARNIDGRWIEARELLTEAYQLYQRYSKPSSATAASALLINVYDHAPLPLLKLESDASRTAGAVVTDGSRLCRVLHEGAVEFIDLNDGSASKAAAFKSGVMTGRPTFSRSGQTVITAVQVLSEAGPPEDSTTGSDWPDPRVQVVRRGGRYLSVDDSATGQSRMISIPAAPKTDLVFSSDEKWIAFGGSDGEIVACELTAASPVVRHLKVPDPILGITAIGGPANPSFLIARQGRVLDRWDGKGPLQPVGIAAADWPEGDVASLAASHDGTRVACGGSNGYVAVFDIRARTMLTKLNGLAGKATHLVWSADDAQLMAGGDGGTVMVWDAVSAVPLRVLGPGSTAVYALSFGAADRLACIVSSDGATTLWPLKTDHPSSITFQSVAGAQEQNRIWSGAFTGDDPFWADRLGAVFRLKEGKAAPVVLARAVATSLQVDARLSRDGTRMLLTSPRGVWLRATSTPDRLTHLDNSASKYPVFAEKGTLAGVISSSTAAKFFDLSGAGRAIGVIPAVNPSCIALSRTGSRAAVGQADGSIVAAETDGPRLLRTLKGQESAITCLCFDRDDHILFSGGADGTVRVWALDSGLELCRLVNGGPPVISLDMDEQSRTLAMLAGGKPVTFDFGRINDLQRLRPLASAAAQSLKDATAAKNPPPTAIAVLHEWYQAMGWSPVTGQQHP